MAQERGCAFLDTGQVIVSSDLDGIHLAASEQRKLGMAVAARVREILGQQMCLWARLTDVTRADLGGWLLGWVVALGRLTVDLRGCIILLNIGQF